MLQTVKVFDKQSWHLAMGKISAQLRLHQLAGLLRSCCQLKSGQVWTLVLKASVLSRVQVTNTQLIFLQCQFAVTFITKSFELESKLSFGFLRLRNGTFAAIQSKKRVLVFWPSKILVLT